MAKILLVDDHPDSREIVSQLLEAHGHSTRCFPSAEDALGAIASEVPDAVITDQRLPGISGIDLLRELRSRFAKLAVFLLSADDTLRDEALAAGAAGFWLKGSDDLFDGIEQLGMSFNHAAG